MEKSKAFCGLFVGDTVARCQLAAVIRSLIPSIPAIVSHVRYLDLVARADNTPTAAVEMLVVEFIIPMEAYDAFFDALGAVLTREISEGFKQRWEERAANQPNSDRTRGEAQT